MKYHVCSKSEGLLFVCQAGSIDDFIAQFIRLGYKDFTITSDILFNSENDCFVIVN